jgi:Spy/CpxP family protein refolding chaperone
MPPRLQETLKLTDDQKKAVAELQKEVDAKLDKILTDEQKKQLKEMRNRRPPRRDNGPDGGPGGDRPGGPPPAEF